MDREASTFLNALPAPNSVPVRRPAPMPAQQIVAWTPTRLVSAFGAWLMEETQLPPLAVTATIKNRRA